RDTRDNGSAADHGDDQLHGRRVPTNLHPDHEHFGVLIENCEGDRRMKRQAGFSLTEVLIATALMVVIMGTTLRALSDATHANEAVTLMADSQENLRAALNYMTKDLIEAGEGLPQGGIPIPNSATLLNPNPPIASAVNRPGPVGGPATFPPSFLTLPAIT